MKTIPNVPACQNMEEIQKLTHLIEEFIHPEMIILFGYYAGMTFQSISGGYEMLILTAEEPEVSFRELNSYLNLQFKKSERKESRLSFHLLTVNFVHHRSSRSYFLSIIRKEGILLYRSESCLLGKEVPYKPVRTHHQAVRYSEQCLALGNAFLEDARRHQENGIPRLAAFYLYQAMVQFIRAASKVHYGFVPRKREDLLTAYLRIRYCSDEIAGLWGGDGQLAEWRLFGHLQAFNYKARFSHPFSLNSDLLTRCMAGTLKTGKAVEKFCQERLHFLANQQI